mmetsp:Transcript_19676/g.47718  ORF Transcript_19676/g.47718 Transcript_19676/m.47718 type:complete len:183 (-) Transcript_19676:52-600(-)
MAVMLKCVSFWGKKRTIREAPRVVELQENAHGAPARARPASASEDWGRRESASIGVETRPRAATDPTRTAMEELDRQLAQSLQVEEDYRGGRMPIRQAPSSVKWTPPTHSEAARACSDEDDGCAICMEQYFENQAMSKLPCSHTFHQTCAEQWLSRSSTCPVCMAQVGQEVPTSSRQRVGWK